MNNRDPNQAAVDKTAQIFKELCVAKYRNLTDPSRPKSTDLGRAARARIIQVFSEALGEDEATQLAVHVTGFPSDIAFVAALLLFPDRFTDEELAAGVRCFEIELSFHSPEIRRLLGESSQE